MDGARSPRRRQGFPTTNTRHEPLAGKQRALSRHYHTGTSRSCSCSGGEEKEGRTARLRRLYHYYEPDDIDKYKPASFHDEESQSQSSSVMSYDDEPLYLSPIIDPNRSPLPPLCPEWLSPSSSGRLRSRSSSYSDHDGDRSSSPRSIDSQRSRNESSNRSYAQTKHCQRSTHRHSEDESPQSQSTGIETSRHSGHDDHSHSQVSRTSGNGDFIDDLPPPQLDMNDLDAEPRFSSPEELAVVKESSHSPALPTPPVQSVDLPRPPRSESHPESTASSTASFNHYPGNAPNAQRIGLEPIVYEAGPHQGSTHSYYLPRTRHYPGPNTTAEDYPHVRVNTGMRSASAKQNQSSQAAPKVASPGMAHPAQGHISSSSTSVNNIENEQGAESIVPDSEIPDPTPYLRELIGAGPDIRDINLWSLQDPPPGEKPNYPYPTLIKLAIYGSPNKRLTLQDIYATIEARFEWFRNVKDRAWRGSIRHNLSLNKCFRHVPRPITEPGKGSFWVVDYSQGEGNKRIRKRNKKPTKSQLRARAEAAAQGAVVLEDDDNEESLGSSSNPPTVSKSKAPAIRVHNVPSQYSTEQTRSPTHPPQTNTCSTSQAGMSRGASAASTRLPQQPSYSVPYIDEACIDPTLRDGGHRVSDGRPRLAPPQQAARRRASSPYAAPAHIKKASRENRNAPREANAAHIQQGRHHPGPASGQGPPELPLFGQGHWNRPSRPEPTFGQSSLSFHPPLDHTSNWPHTLPDEPSTSANIPRYREPNSLNPSAPLSGPVHANPGADRSSTHGMHLRSRTTDQAPRRNDVLTRDTIYHDSRGTPYPPRGDGGGDDDSDY